MDVYISVGYLLRDDMVQWLRQIPPMQVYAGDPSLNPDAAIKSNHRLQELYSLLISHK